MGLILQATDHLIRTGHERIVHLGGKPDSATENERLAGYVHAMQEADLVVEPSFVQYTMWTAQSGYEATLRVLAARNGATAIFAGNDLLALGALRALHESGVRVPDDMSIIGFDDWPFAEHTAPPLTTMRIERKRYGQLAAQMALDRMHHPEGIGTIQRAAAMLIVRESTANAAVASGSEVATR